MNQITNDLFEYTDMEFWDILARNFAKRELDMIYSKEEQDAMDELEFMKKFFLLHEKYHEEFEENGMENVSLSI